MGAIMADLLIELYSEEIPAGMQAAAAEQLSRKIEEFLKNILNNKSDYLKKKENLKKLNYQNSWNNVNQKILKIINEN